MTANGLTLVLYGNPPKPKEVIPETDVFGTASQ